MSESRLINATTLAEALAAVANGARPVAGGSDLVVGARQGKASLPSELVAIDRLGELKGIEWADDGLHIGAAITHAELESSVNVAARYSALADASALVGSPSTRNVGTIGGNVMNASPAMDTGAPLVVFGALVMLQSSDRARTVPIGELWEGPGRTSARSDELCVGVFLPSRPAHSGSAYVRLEYRRAMEIAVVGAAAALTLDPHGSVSALRVALTAVAPTIIEVSLDGVVGLSVADAARVAGEAASAQARPISDLRANDRYRRHTVGVMASRAVAAAARRAAGETIPVPVNRALGIGAAR